MIQEPYKRIGKSAFYCFFLDGDEFLNPSFRLMRSEKYFDARLVVMVARTVFGSLRLMNLKIML